MSVDEEVECGEAEPWCPLEGIWSLYLRDGSDVDSCATAGGGVRELLRLETAGFGITDGFRLPAVTFADICFWEPIGVAAFPCLGTGGLRDAT